MTNRFQEDIYMYTHAWKKSFESASKHPYISICNGAIRQDITYNSDPQIPATKDKTLRFLVKPEWGTPTLVQAWQSNMAAIITWDWIYKKKI